MSDKPPKILPYGHFQPETGFKLKEPPRSTMERRFDLTGMHLRISTIAYKPYTYLDEDETYRGMMMDVVSYVQVVIHFMFLICIVNVLS